MHETRIPLNAISPLDGRYADQLAPLADRFSEHALIRRRVEVEIAYLKAILPFVHGPEALTPLATALLNDLLARFGTVDLETIKVQEAVTRHDVKAVEYWLKARLREIPDLAPHLELVHIGLTSEDVNNLAWALMHRDAVKEVLLPALAEVIQVLIALTRAHRALPMLARTHGQPASPTTFGKEMGVFATRLARAYRAIAGIPLTGKLAGATGTHAALTIAYPDRDWLQFSDDFVRGLGLLPLAVVTQVAPRDDLAALYDATRRAGNIATDLCLDLWRYVSDGWLVQQARVGEVGSSAMPHKINPIDFENAEGNLGLAAALLTHLADKLVKSRLQRDLSDSTVLRNAGVGLGHFYLACRSLARGLARVAPEGAAMRAALDAHPEVLAEAIQTVGRALGAEHPYERLKDLTQGKAVDLGAMREAGLAIAPQRAEIWRSLTPAAYTGLAPQLADRAAAEAEASLT